MNEIIKNNELIKNNNSVRISFFRKKRNWFIKMYLKSNKIDTIIHDIHSSINFNYISNNNEIKNIIYDLENKNNLIIEPSPNIKNISFLGYPMLEGITIPIDMIKNNCNISINGIAYSRNIKRINILINDEIKTFYINDTYNYFEIEINSKIIIKLIENFEDVNRVNKRTIIIDEKGIVNDCYPYYFYDKTKLDLKEHLDKHKIIFDDDSEDLDEFIFDLKYLKNIKLKDFRQINVNKLKIIDKEDMKLIPNDMEYDDVQVTISDDNKAILIEDKYSTVTYIYFDEQNKINVIKDKEIFRYINFNFYNGHIGIIFKKDKLVYEIFINNKKYIVDKKFIEWIIKDNDNCFQKFIYDKCKDKYIEYEELDNILENKLLGEILFGFGIGKFEELYDKYKNNINHIDFLKSQGFTNEAIDYLIKNNYNNILGINQEFKESYINCDIIETFNELGKKLVKRRD